MNPTSRLGEYPRRCSELGLPEHFNTIILQRSDQRGKKDFELPGVADCGKANLWRKLMVGQGQFQQGSRADSSGAISELTGSRAVVLTPFPAGRGGRDTFTNVCLAFGQIRGGQRAFLVSALLSRLQLKITLMPKFHIWRWQILLPFTYLNNKNQLLEGQW